MSKLTSVIKTEAPAATVIIRIMVGAVFISEGIQKFVNPAEVGAGRFAKIGLPSPEFLAPLVGGFEIACGTLLLFGVLTRLAVLPLLGIMATAIVTTKFPILMQSGFWKLAHDARTGFRDDARLAVPARSRRRIVVVGRAVGTASSRPDVMSAAIVHGRRTFPL
jgi:uncharacterized membrane protein YphA (DoxX/SURF4 family)